MDLQSLSAIILRQAQDEVKPLKNLTLTLSLSKGEGGGRHKIYSLLKAIPVTAQEHTA